VQYRKSRKAVMHKQNKSEVAGQKQGIVKPPIDKISLTTTKKLLAKQLITTDSSTHYM
jgi:hypothetical protein